MRVLPFLFLAGCQLLGDALPNTSETETDGPEDNVLVSGEDSGRDSEGDSGDDAEDEPDGEVSFIANWSADGVYLSIENGSRTYLFGMAEEVADGWFGEDGLAGAVGGASGDYDINHDDVGSAGITLDSVPSAGEVVANRSTLLSPTIAAAGHLAYVLFDNTTGRCWEQNDDPVLDHYPCD